MRTKRTARRQRKDGRTKGNSTRRTSRSNNTAEGQLRGPASRVDDENTPLAPFIQQCLTLPWLVVRRVVNRCRTVESSGLQAELIHVLLCRLLGPGKEPHPHQVRALRRLVFHHGDTLLVASTGFGKSIIFQAYSIITGRVTIQIIPLSRLGDQQYQKLLELPESKPCLITHTSKFLDPQLFSNIAACRYTHVLLGPEQAMSPEFFRVLQSPCFQVKIGLVAIDECHLLHQWASFRDSYKALYELRRCLPTDAIFFGCSATITAAAELAILKHAGFLDQSALHGGLYTIRVSVDRPEISVSFVPIPKGQTTKYTMLGSLIFGDVYCRQQPPPVLTIRKTIVFVDSRTKVSNIAGFLKQSMVDLGWDISTANNTVAIYTARVAEHDQTRVYRTFESSTSEIRIVVATTSLGMGMDLNDVEDVMQWDMPITNCIADLWQRFGRAARERGRTGRAVMFAPYWLFNNQGFERAEHATTSAHRPAVSSTPQTVNRRQRNVMRRDRQLSSLRREVGVAPITPESLHGNAALSSSQTGPSSRHRLNLWTKQEMESRVRTPSQWLDCINAPCRRAAILAHLQDYLSEPDTHPVPAEPEVCCNGSGCNPALITMLPVPLSAVTEESAPTESSRAGIALCWLQQWCRIQGNSVTVRGSADSEMFGELPSGFFMPSSVQWSVARTFTPGTKNLEKYPICSIDDLRRIPTIRAWDRLEEWGNQLVVFLRQSVEGIIQQYDTKVAARRRQQVYLQSSAMSTRLSQDATGSLERTLEQRTQDDNDMARQACLFQAMRHSFGSTGDAVLLAPTQTGPAYVSRTAVLQEESMFGNVVPSSPLVVPSSPLVVPSSPLVRTMPLGCCNDIQSPSAASSMFGVLVPSSPTVQRTGISLSQQGQLDDSIVVPDSQPNNLPTLDNIVPSSPLPDLVHCTSKLLTSPIIASQQLFESSPVRIMRGRRSKRLPDKDVVCRTLTSPGALSPRASRRCRSGASKRVLGPLQARDPNCGVLTMATQAKTPRRDGRQRRVIKLSAVAEMSGMYQLSK